MSQQQEPPSRREGNISISGSVKGQNVAIGHQSSINITGNVSQGADSTIDLAALKSSLEELYELLGSTNLPLKQKMALQGSTGQAVELTEEHQPKAEALAAQIKQMGETFQTANATIDAGSQLGQKILKIATIVGPLVGGGARLVAGWFGLPLP